MKGMKSVLQPNETPIRILHIVTNMSYGGLENLLMNYYRNIDREIIQFDFLTHVDIHQDFEDEIRMLGGRIYRLPRLNPFSPSYRKKLDGFFRLHPEYTIAHCHLDCLAGIPLKAAQKNHVPIRIAHGHGCSQNHNLKYLIKMLYKPTIPRYATALFACGEKAGDWMFGGEPYTVMRNAIDAGAFRYGRERACQKKEELGFVGKFVIGHVGQFREEKNHLFLIEVFAEIARKDDNCVLLLVGKGPKMEPAKERARALGIAEKVCFAGARSDIPELMQAMDVFVLSSIYEGLPVTMVEAQAAGLPCVISSGISAECKLTDAVEQIALSEGAPVWADRILTYKTFSRQDTYDRIVESGFDIQANARWLKDFYLGERNVQEDL